MDENTYKKELHANGFITWEYSENGARAISVYEAGTLRALGHFGTYAEAHAKLC